MGDCWCCVVDGVCIFGCNVVVVYIGWSVGCGISGGVLGVGIWIGVYFGIGGVVFGGGIMVVVVGGVVCGFGGGVVVFCLQFRLLSIVLAIFGQAIFPA